MFRKLLLVAVVAAGLIGFGPTSLKGIDCDSNPGHEFFDDRYGRSFCNPGGDQCIRCIEVIVVTG